LALIFDMIFAVHRTLIVKLLNFIKKRSRVVFHDFKIYFIRRFFDLKIGFRHFGYETDCFNRDYFELLNMN